MLEYYYKKYHGDLKGLDDIKSQAALTTFPPGTLVIAPAPTPAEIAHKLIAETPNLKRWPWTTRSSSWPSASG